MEPESFAVRCHALLSPSAAGPAATGPALSRGAYPVRSLVPERLSGRGCSFGARRWLRKVSPAGVIGTSSVTAARPRDTCRHGVAPIPCVLRSEADAGPFLR